jgi:hypothetical protein
MTAFPSGHSCLIVCALTLGLGATTSVARINNEVIATPITRAQTYGKLPLSFEANKGQTDSRVKFVSHGHGYTLFLTADEAVLKLSRDDKASVLRMKLVGANSSVKTSGVEEMSGKTNYFIGNDPAKWLIGVPNYSKVKYASAYPGVDLVYYGNQRQLEYDFVVAPGSDPHAIALELGAKRKLRIEANGDLRVAVDDGEVYLHKPVVYQEVTAAGSSTAARHFIDGRWVLKNRTQVGFEVGDYDRSRMLVIDPVLSYSSYLGGNNTDVGNGVGVDSAGNAYFAGRAQSTNFPTTTGSVQSKNAGGSDAFVAKLNASGSALIYSTYLGGSGADIAFALTLDQATGNVYIAGSTSSTNFPTTPGAIQSVCGGGCTGVGNSSVFVSALNSTGSALIYSTYLAGTIADEALALSIAEDGTGEAYVTGKTGSTNFPTTPGSLQTTLGGAQNAFVSKLNATGTALVYSTYLGGSGTDAGLGIKVDSSGNAYVTGNTSSSNFPTTAGAYQTACAGGCTASDAFVTKINQSGSALVYSTLLGGTGSDNGTAIALDSTANAYITGFTCSTDLPTSTTAFQKTYGGGTCTNSGGDVFVAKFNSTGSVLEYSTYLGGISDDAGFAIGVSASGTAWISGGTASKNFPTTAGAFQTTLAGASDVFITALNSTGSGLLYSTLIGGTGTEVSYALTVASTGYPYVVGKTTSTDFPVTPGAFQVNSGGGTSDAFIVKLSPGDQVWPEALSMGSVNIGSSSGPLVTKLSNSTTAALKITSVSVAGTGASDFSQTNTCGTSLAAGASCNISVTFTPTATGVLSASMSIVDGAPNSPQVVALSGTGTQSSVTLSPTSLTFATETVGLSSEAQTLTLTNGGTATITIASIAAAGPFSQTNNCGTTLAAAASCTVSVVYAPTTSGVQTGTITVTETGSSTPQVAALTGTGTFMSMSPENLNFGTQKQGSSSQPQTVTLKNVGTATVTITKIAITGPHVSSYSETNTCGATLAAGASCTASVTFTPQLKGALSAALSIQDTAGGSPQTVAVSGTGQ